MSLFAVYYGPYENDFENYKIVTVFDDLESAIKWVNETVELEEASVYGFYLMKFESGKSLESGIIIDLWN